MLSRSLQFTMWFCFLYLPQLKLQASAFLQINAGRSYHHQPASPSSLINLAMTPPNNNSDDDTNPNSRNRTPVDANTSILNHRLSKMRAQLFEDQLALPPNPNLTPTEFVTSILEQLKHPDAFMPQSGFRTLVRSSSGQWKEKLRRSIGVPPDLDGLVKEDTFISALASAISRPNNQYQILVHDSDHDYDDEKKGGTRKSYDDTELYFPGDVVDYMDGKCWLEAQLRDRESGKLLVILGWSLVQNERREWLIDRLDWQDFRDEFRPGIGREEWMRICG